MPYIVYYSTWEKGIKLHKEELILRPVDVCLFIYQWEPGRVIHGIELQIGEAPDPEYPTELFDVVNMCNWRFPKQEY
jgi:hypothetical protein